MEDQPRTLFSQVKIGSVDLEEMSKIWFMDDGRTTNSKVLGELKML
jgi:hypothetical protein